MRPNRPLLVLLALVGAALPAFACGGSTLPGKRTSSGGSSAGGGGAGAGGSPTASGGSSGSGSGGCVAVSTGDPACDSCVDSFCCSQVAACFSDINCKGLLVCIVQNCASPASSNDFNTCINQDCKQYASALNEYNEVGACEQNHCNTQCGAG